MAFPCCGAFWNGLSAIQFFRRANPYHYVAAKGPADRKSQVLITVGIFCRMYMEAAVELHHAGTVLAAFESGRLLL